MPRSGWIALGMAAGVGLLVFATSRPWGRIEERNRQVAWVERSDSAYVMGTADAQVFGFDGMGNRVFVPDSAELNFGRGEDFTVEAWIKPFPACSSFELKGRAWLAAHPRVYMLLPRRLARWIDAHWRDNDFDVTPIVGKSRTPSILEAVGFTLHLYRGRLACQLAQEPMRPLGFENFVSASPDLRDRRWHHVALSVERNGAEGGKLYADGVVVLSFDPRKQAGSLATTEPLRIGNHANSALRCYFKGQIGAVTIHRRSLSSEEMGKRFREGPPRR